MTDVFTKARRSEVMSPIRSGGNQGTELKLMALMEGLKITGWRRSFGHVLQPPPSEAL